MSERRLRVVENRPVPPADAAELMPAEPHATPGERGIARLYATEAFWTGIANGRAELRRRYGGNYDGEQDRLDGERQNEGERLAWRCRVHLPVPGSRDFEAWFRRWRKPLGDAR